MPEDRISASEARTDEGHGNIFFVDSNARLASDDFGNGSREMPYATIAHAVSQCIANNSDVIYVMPRHSESNESPAVPLSPDVFRRATEAMRALNPIAKPYGATEDCPDCDYGLLMYSKSSREWLPCSMCGYERE